MESLAESPAVSAIFLDSESSIDVPIGQVWCVVRVCEHQCCEGVSISVVRVCERQCGEGVSISVEGVSINVVRVCEHQCGEGVSISVVRV